jgi:ABC-type uncharacterized transport system ATPase subunit
LENRIEKSKLAALGDLQSYIFPKVVYTVDRNQAAAFVAKLLNELPVADMNIIEPEIEEIIRDVFTRNK